MANTIDTELVTALKQTRSGKALRFAFVAQGTAGKLLVGRQVPPKQLAEAKREVGGGTIFQGRCLGEDGKLVFEVAKAPPASLAGQLRHRIKEDAGLAWTVEVRVRNDAEAELTDESRGGHSTPAVPLQDGRSATPPAAAGVAVLSRFKEMAPAIKAALAGPNAARVQALTVGANGLIKSNDFTQAGKVLDELEPLLRISPATTAAALLRAPTPPAAAAPAAPTPAAGAAVLNRLKEMAPAIKAAQAGPNAAQVQAAMAAANGFIRSKDFAQAVKVLNDLQPLLGAAPASAAPPPPPPPPMNGAAVLNRLKAMAPAIRAAQAGPNAARVQAAMAAANGFIKGQDFAQAAKVLNDLQSLLAAASEAAPKVAGIDDVRTRWRGAREAVGIDIGKLQSALKQEGDSRFDRIAEMGLHGITGRLQVGLDAALIDLEQAGVDAARRAKALKFVEEMRQFLAGNKVVALCEDNPFGVAVKIREPLLASLSEVESVLKQ